MPWWAWLILILVAIAITVMLYNWYVVKSEKDFLLSVIRKTEDVMTTVQAYEGLTGDNWTSWRDIMSDIAATAGDVARPFRVTFAVLKAQLVTFRYNVDTLSTWPVPVGRFVEQQARELIKLGNRG